MGQDEYKMQFVECAQAKRQLSKLHKSGTISRCIYSHASVNGCLSRLAGLCARTCMGECVRA